MKLIVKCRVLWHGQQILPPFALTYSGEWEDGPDLPDVSGENDSLHSPYAVARTRFSPTLQCGPSQTARYPDAIDALLEVKTFELRYNSLDRAVERLRQLVREGRRWRRKLDRWAGSGLGSVNAPRVRAASASRIGCSLLQRFAWTFAADYLFFGSIST
jgi:hypothetical protein